MKIIKDISILLCFLQLFSCNSTYSPDYDGGYIEGELNENFWKAEADGYQIDGEPAVVYFSIYNSEGYLREEMTLSGITLAKSIYPLNSERLLGDTISIITFYGTLISDGDIIDNIYKPTEGSLEVVSYNLESRQLIGKLEGTFMNSNPDKTDTLNFKNCYFELFLE